MLGQEGEPPRGRVLGSAVGACSGRSFYPLRIWGEGINGRSGPLKSQPSRAEGPTPPPRPCPHLPRKERAGWLLDGPSQFPARRGRGWAWCWGLNNRVGLRGRKRDINLPGSWGAADRVPLVIKPGKYSFGSSCDRYAGGRSWYICIGSYQKKTLLGDWVILDLTTLLGFKNIIKICRPGITGCSEPFTRMAYLLRVQLLHERIQWRASANRFKNESRRG